MATWKEGRFQLAAWYVLASLNPTLPTATDYTADASFPGVVLLGWKVSQMEMVLFE